MNVQVSEEGAGQPRQFATTRWSLILSAANSQSEEQKARDALEELCRIYWRPVFVFACRRGYSIQDAQDLTQDFFLKILEPHWLEHADRNRGRFRTLLLTSLQNFLVKAAEKTRARKRGGHLEFVSWDDWMAEAPSQLSISAHALGRCCAMKSRTPLKTARMFRMRSGICVRRLLRELNEKR